MGFIEKKHLYEKKTYINIQLRSEIKCLLLISHVTRNKLYLWRNFSIECSFTHWVVYVETVVTPKQQAGWITKDGEGLGVLTEDGAGLGVLIEDEVGLEEGGKKEEGKGP